jgi:hypothetical protein
VEPLAHALESEGFSVWWDPELPIGQNYTSSIRAALNEARAVIPVWTALSAQSEWVQEEATHGKRRGVLFPVRLDEVDPPIGFSMVETVDLIGWPEGDSGREEWSRLLEQLRAKLRGVAPPVSTGGQVAVKERRGLWQLVGNRMGTVAVGAAVLLAVVALFFLIGREPDDDTPGDSTSAADASASTPAVADGPPGRIRPSASTGCASTESNRTRPTAAERTPRSPRGCADAIELGRGAHEQAIPGDGRRSQRHLVETVPAHQLEDRARLDDEGVAVLAEDEDLVVVRPR